MSVTVLKHNSSHKVTLFQNIKNMFRFSKTLFIALGPVIKLQSQILESYLFVIKRPIESYRSDILVALHINFSF